MFNQQMYNYGNSRSVIRDLFEYGIQRAKIVGKEKVYDYSLGNPSVPAPAEVGEAIAELLKGDSLKLHSYTPAFGDAEAREAIINDLTQRTGMKFSVNKIFFTCGAAPALCAILNGLKVEDAEIMAIAPFFPEYTVFTEAAGMKFVMAPAREPDFGIPYEAIEQLLTSHTQAIIVNSPNNPSGVVYTKEDLEKLAAILTRKSAEYGHPIYIIADEPYRELVYDGNDSVFIPAIYKDTVICYSYSKSLSLPGERIGYVLVPDCATDSDDLMKAFAGAARAYGHVCAPSLFQKVAAKCCEVRPDIAAYDLNRKTLYDALTSYGYECVKPQGAFYLFVKAPGGDANAFSDKAKAKDLLIVPGDGFGCPGYFRISTCVDHGMILRSLPIFKEIIEK